jgi:hypothetical protein
MQKIQNYLSSTVFLTALLAMGCNPMDALYDQIEDTAHIVFRTPLAFSGPGTIVGGGPTNLTLVAPPQSCFPPNIVVADRTALPQKKSHFEMSGSAAVELTNSFSNGNPILGVGIGFDIVENVSVTMEGVHIEYIDLVEFTRYYRSGMDSICKEYLGQFGFILQALKVDRLEFTFYRKTGGAIKLDYFMAQYLTKISANVSWQIVDDIKLVIEEPKYMGYQVGRVDDLATGMVRSRAKTTSGNRFVFETIAAPPISKDRSAFALFATPDMLPLVPRSQAAVPVSAELRFHQMNR